MHVICKAHQRLYMTLDWCVIVEEFGRPRAWQGRPGYVPPLPVEPGKGFAPHLNTITSRAQMHRPQYLDPESHYLLSVSDTRKSRIKNTKALDRYQLIFLN